VGDEASYDFVARLILPFAFISNIIPTVHCSILMCLSSNLAQKILFCSECPNCAELLQSGVMPLLWAVLCTFLGEGRRVFFRVLQPT
jgi:hypothetical protein